MKKVNTQKSFPYQAFLLRCWQAEGAEWRFRLQNVQTGEQKGFNNLDTMLAFLRDVFESIDPD